MKAAFLIALVLIAILQNAHASTDTYVNLIAAKPKLSLQNSVSYMNVYIRQQDINLPVHKPSSSFSLNAFMISPKAQYVQGEPIINNVVVETNLPAPIISSTPVRASAAIYTKFMPNIGASGIERIRLYVPLRTLPATPISSDTSIYIPLRDMNRDFDP